MKTFLRCLVLALTLMVVLVSPAAAYLDCRYIIDVYSNGTQTCTQVCHIYNPDGSYGGWFSREFQC